MPGVGVVVELRPLAPGDDAKEPRLALPRRAAQPAPLPRVLAAEPVDLRVTGRIPMFTPPTSVTISSFLSSLIGLVFGIRNIAIQAALIPGKLGGALSAVLRHSTEPGPIAREA